LSRTYSLACKDCQVHLWVGQTTGPDAPGIMIYSGADTDHQIEFLRDHAGHPVVFIENCEAILDLEGDFVELYDESDVAPDDGEEHEGSIA
jgi:hypothetical protein